MRQIELLGAFVSKLIKRIENNELEEAAADADRASRQFVGVPLVVLENQPPDGFEAVLSMAGQFDYMRGLAAATLLSLRAKLAHAEGDETTAFRHWTLAASLLIRCHQSPDDEVRNACESRLEDLLTTLQEYEIPEFLHRSLTLHYERIGDLSSAENHLFQALEEREADVFDWARDFYARLETLTDCQLVDSHFSRDEIRDGLAEVAKLQTES